MKLRRLSAEGTKQTLVVPRHRELDAGTCRAILRQASRYVDASELAPLFWE